MVWRAMKRDNVSDILIFYFIAVWFVGGLSVLHFYLVATNQTTYENFRYCYDKNENPYNKGMIKSFLEVFFTKMSPLMHDSRAFVKEEDIMAMENTDHSSLESINNSYKEKIDIDMGGRPDDSDGLTIPEILLSIERDAMMIESPKHNEGIEVKQTDFETKRTLDLPVEHEPKESSMSFISVDDTMEVKLDDDIVSEQEKPVQT